MPKRKTQEEFEKEVLEKLGPEYKVLDTYKGAHSKITLYHAKCEQTFLKNVHDIVTRGSGCPYCNGVKPALYNEQWVIDNTPPGYLYVNGYTKMTNKCKFYCQTCKTEFYQSPSRLINGKIYGCNCCPTKKLTNDEFLEILGEDCLEEYDILESYVNMDAKISFKHKKCGTVFQLSPYKFISRHQKHYCPICYYKKSKGEIAINLFLEKNDIKYVKECSFPDLKQYKFDFYLPEFNAIIEFDGEQHFRPIGFFGGQEQYKIQQLRDKEKNLYCLKKGIDLYRIPYYEELYLEEILTKIFKEKSSTTIERYKITEQSKEL